MALKDSPAGYRAYQRGKYYEYRQRLNQYKEGKPCLDCGGFFPSWCMDFDHVRGEKLRGVGNLHSYKKEKFWAEVAKCDLVCANCHRDRTYKRGQMGAKRIDAV